MSRLLRWCSNILVVLSLWIASPAFALCILGIGSCEPSEGDAKAVFEAKIAGMFEAPYTLVYFKKTNGRKGSILGREVYEIEFDAVLSYPNDDLRCQNRCPGLSSYKVLVDEKKKLVAIYGWIGFENTERGWGTSLLCERSVGSRENGNTV
jgi:hypothetical protein